MLFSQTQEVIADSLHGEELLQYIINNYKTTTTLGYENAKDTLYALIDLHDTDQLTCVYSGFTITLDLEADPSTDADTESHKSDLHKPYIAANAVRVM